jgi:hypothetical protein
VVKRRASRLLEAVDDAAAGEVVRREFDGYAVSREYLDEVHAHAAGDVGKDVVFVVEFHAKSSVRQALSNGPFELNEVLLGFAGFRGFVATTDVSHNPPCPQRRTVE